MEGGGRDGREGEGRERGREEEMEGGRGRKGGGGRENGTGEEHVLYDNILFTVKFTLLGILHATIRHWSVSMCIAIYGKQLLAWGRAEDMRMGAPDYKY